MTDDVALERRGGGGHHYHCDTYYTSLKVMEILESNGPHGGDNGDGMDSGYDNGDMDNEKKMTII